jgi:hypothetical protein
MRQLIGAAQPKPTPKLATAPTAIGELLRGALWGCVVAGCVAPVIWIVHRVRENHQAK